MHEPASEPGYRYDTTLIPLIISLGSILRICNFWSPPVWIDEYGTWWVVSADTWSEVIERTLRIQGQSPLYYLLVKAITVIGGYGSFQLRLLSVVAGIATLTLVYPLTLKIFNDRRVALGSLMLIAISEPFIWYAQIARPYSLALFFTFVSFWSFVALENEPTRAWRALYIVSTALAIYAHYLFGWIVVVQAIYVVIRSGPRALFSKFWVVNFLVLIMLLAPASTHILYLHSRRHDLDWVSSVDSYWKVAGGIIYIIGAASPVAILATAFAVILLGFRRSEIKNLDTRRKLTLPLIWYFVPIIVFSVLPVVFGINLGQPRYLLFAYPATYLLFAWLMLNVEAEGFRRWLPTGVFITATVLFVSLPAFSSTGTFSRWPSHSWNDALANVRELYTPETLVVAQIGLIETDLLANDSHDPILFPYLSWPLTTTVPGLRETNIALLPYRLTDHTQTYFQSILKRAASYGRVCLVGGGELVALFHEHLVHDFGFEVVKQTRHGDDFYAILFARSAALKGDNR